MRTLVPLACVLLAGLAAAQEEAAAQRPEPVGLKSVGPLAFAPNTLLVSDRVAASIHAISLGELDGVGLRAGTEVEGVDRKLAALLSTTTDQLQIVDMAVHPDSRLVFFAVQRGDGPDAMPVLALMHADGKMVLFELEGRASHSVKLPNPPEPGQGRNRERHLESITDVAYVDGKVVVAGLSNEEFASKLRVLDYPFASADAGASVEIYHGAHGALETRSPVRTFVPYMIGGDPALLAAYTCTPLVRLELSELQPGKKVKGVTVAELGNRNRPLDMIVYEKDGGQYLLIANSSRGVMKVPTAGVEDAVAIEARVAGGGTAGIDYQTIESLEGVVQLDKLDDEHAVILVQTEDGRLDLRVIALP